MLKRSVLLTGLTLFGSSSGMISEQQLELSGNAIAKIANTADLVEKAVENNDKSKVIELLRDGLNTAINTNNKFDVSDLLNAVAPVAEAKITDVLREMFDNAAELRRFDIARLILQASPDEICVGYAFDQGLSAKSAEGTEFASWLLKHPSARMQYTPRYEDEVCTVSCFLAPAIIAGDAEIIRSVIDGTLEELVLYEQSENLNRFLKDELDPLYNSESMNVLPSKSLVKDMFDTHINKIDRALVYLLDSIDVEENIEKMKRLVANWASERNGTKVSVKRF